jgi:hypothetical protein
MQRDYTIPLPEERHKLGFEKVLQAVKETVSLHEYAAQHTDLEGFGRGWWTGRCPLDECCVVCGCKKGAIRLPSTRSNRWPSLTLPYVSPERKMP